MKVFHLTTVPQSLLFLKGQLNYYQSKNMEISIVTSPGIEAEKFSEVENINAHYVSMTREISPFKDLKALYLLWKLFKAEKPDIVHSHTPKASLLGMLASFLVRTPVRIYHIHGFYYMGSTGAKRMLLKFLEKVTCYLATQIYIVSFSLRDYAVEEKIISTKKIKVIHHGTINGINTDSIFNPALFVEAKRTIRNELKLPKDAFVIGFVGRLVIDKGIKELVMAWESIQNKYPEKKIRLVILGEEEYVETTKILLETLKNDPHVHFVGFVEKLAPYYLMMDVLVLPSYREGFGSVAAEASAMGIPVVATRIPGCIDSVEDGVTGILVEPRNYLALQKGIEFYMENELMKKTHGLAGRNRVVRLYNPEVIWKNTYMEYIRLSKG